MATVRRTRTTVFEIDVDDGDGFQPEVALGIAKGLEAWTRVTDEVTYEVREGEQVCQLAGRAPREEDVNAAR
ncbi:MAG: hypothetical protein HYX53_02965 [Chloroflexi bacterium]|nr:hypothetical protein [Chloroflexota bacterium]